MVFNAPLIAQAVAVALMLLGSISASSNVSPACRFIPGDAEWPTEKEWQALNRTVGDRLIRGVPLAQACYQPNLDNARCAKIRGEWIQVDP